VDINYGSELMSLSIADGNLCFELGPRSVEGTPNAEEEIRRAIAEPIGCPPLPRSIQAGSHVMIIADDNTRPTPADIILPILLDRLNSAGVSDGEIDVIVASGTHRPMTSEEIQRKFGAEVLSRVRVRCHDYLDRQNLVDYGVTDRGTRIWINRQVVEADMRIGVGNIVPHHPTGWAGGAKILLPGVAGQETTAQMHLLGSREPHLGTVVTPCRQEMEEFAARVGIDFIINTVLNREEEIVAVVAGDIVEAHRAGVERAKQVWGTEFSQPADLTISSTYPIDFDLFQANKGIFSAELATARGGEIVLVSPCYEGISPAHSELLELGNLSDEQVWAHLQRGEIGDPLAAAEALCFNHIKRNYTVTLVSEGVTKGMAARIGLNHVSPGCLPDYIQRRLTNNPKIQIGVIHQSAEMLPIRACD
jgi:nickel-dependent lactate racemase